MTWHILEHPGYFGKKRDELYEKWDKELGKNNWRIAYVFGKTVVPRKMGIQIYEDAYHEFLKNNHELLEWLVSTASDIYDTAPTNVHSGFDYEIQETSNNHLHDISIRRAVARLGTCFKGKRLLRIRSNDSEGYVLSPGIVPFHLPELIFQGEIKDYGNKGIWWQEKSIEDFYQKNKVLQFLRIELVQR